MEILPEYLILMLPGNLSDYKNREGETSESPVLLG